MNIENVNLSALNDIASVVHALAKEKGWHSYVHETDAQYIARACANFHGEVSELWEAFRTGKLEQPCDKAEKMRELCNGHALSCEREEVADILIRVLDYAARRNIDVAQAVYIKNLYNASREYRHGGKAA
jgi:NTP pyrophosphatase (non-canonical NTP hydrolase)